jgi:hypothetical protein
VCTNCQTRETEVSVVWLRKDPTDNRDSVYTETSRKHGARVGVRPRERQAELRLSIPLMLDTDIPSDQHDIAPHLVKDPPQEPLTYLPRYNSEIYETSIQDSPLPQAQSQMDTLLWSLLD